MSLEDIEKLTSSELADAAYETVDTKLVEPAEKKNQYIRLKFGLMQALLRNFHHKLDVFMDDTRKSIISWFDWQKNMIDWQKEINAQSETMKEKVSLLVSTVDYLEEEIKSLQEKHDKLCVLLAEKEVKIG